MWICPTYQDSLSFISALFLQLCCGRRYNCKVKKYRLEGPHDWTGSLQILTIAEEY